MVFPDKTMSTLTTQSNGLIALLPVPLSMLTTKKALSTQASVVHKSANDFPMNQIERLDNVKTYHNRYDDDEFTDNNNIPALVSDGSSSDISTDDEDSDEKDEDFDVTQSNLNEGFRVRVYDEDSDDNDEDFDVTQSNLNEEQVDTLISKSDGRAKSLTSMSLALMSLKGGITITIIPRSLYVKGLTSTDTLSILQPRLHVNHL
jgi:hypothetical protein